MVVGEMTQRTDLLVIGAGPGGYAAAFRAADLGLDVTIVDAMDRMGGLCLYEGCIPSKTLLYLSELINEAQQSEKMGLHFGKPHLNLDTLRTWKNGVISKIGCGLKELTKKRDIQWLKGKAFFETSDTVRLIGSDVAHIKFKHAIVATGSKVQTPKQFVGKIGERIIDSSAALELKEVPDSLLIVGGGYIAVELGQVYHALGSKITMAVRSEILRKVDRDLVRPLCNRMTHICEAIHLNTSIQSFKETNNRVDVTLQDKSGKVTQQTFDQVLLAAGRGPLTNELGLENTSATIDNGGYLEVNDTMQSKDPRIFAVGDIVRGPMLAHRAMRQGKVAAEVIAGLPSAFDTRAIPAVVYTDPQVAWCGLTEQDAKKLNLPYTVAKFPWGASGRAATMGLQDKGLTKLILEPETGRILGAGITGRDAEALIAENVLAIEMGALAEDLVQTLHPHPSLTETEGEAAEVFFGNATHYISAK